MSQPLLFARTLYALFTFIVCTITQHGCRGVPFVATSFSTEIVDMLLKACETGRSCMALTGLHQQVGNKLFCKIV